MGFDNVVNDSNINPAASPEVGTNNEQLSVKISHGNEIRRVTLPQTSYISLVEHTASLFNLPQPNINLKYEDEDGDKISMSSEIELREALRLSKASQKILRLFVELRAVVPSESVPKAEVNTNNPTPAAAPVPSPNRDVYLGPQGGRFGLPAKPLPPPPPPQVFPLSPGFPPHPHPHPHPPHPHPHPPHHAPPGFSPADFHHPIPPHFAPMFHSAVLPSAPPQQPAPPATTSTTTSTTVDPAHVPTYAAPLTYSSHSDGMDTERGGSHHGPDHRHQHRRGHHNHFGPHSTYGSSSTGTWSYNDKHELDKKAHKEEKRMMKEQWREMKAEMKKGGFVSEADKMRFKAMKEEFKLEMKLQKKDALLSMKSMKLSDKKQRLVARHVEDVTIPDGTELPPNTPFIKTWKIRNEGPAWPVGSQLLFVSHKGDNLNGPERVVIRGEVLPGQEVEVSVPLITPNEPGRYVGYYRMVTPDNVKFGQRVWVSFIVTRPNEGPTSISTNELSQVCDNMDK